MIRGTTPTHVFSLPIATEDIKKVRIVYAQNDKPVFVKTEADCTMQGCTIQVTLKQEDTLALDCHKCVQIQIRVLTNQGDALASQTAHVRVEKCLENEVIR